MYVDLPEDLIERLRKMASAHHGVSEAELLRKALNALDLQDEELKQVREIERRVAEIESGNAVTIPWAQIRDESLGRLRNRPSDK